MEAWVILAIGLSNLACFIVGALVGQAVRKGKDIGEMLQSAAPTEVIKAHKRKSEAQKEMDRMDTIMRNIESYDGTPIGQREVK